ncbi:50S ribosomal protein L28 [Bifidobacterium sp. 82T24]|uniref:50S ribosomal protein L28 n=1 Tax=Bifidobacterium pluvialisilvae TaxID=2834436 RepID=UPI001C55CAC0|nr:50S ribosomal protein L28 [Bifidobacterium pluvialisilvae]MBW3089054.1 50S ribosomal protein L28 [Bifidobacterium pluvialisilvae]
MTKHCQVTGRRAGVGNRVSHSHRKTRRRFGVNLQHKTYWVPSLGRRITLTVSARGIRTIDRRGIDVVVAELIRRNEITA